MLDGRVAIVTGSAQGIARAIYPAFADKGARVAIVDIDAEEIASGLPRLQGLLVPHRQHTLVDGMSCLF